MGRFETLTHLPKGNSLRGVPAAKSRIAAKRSSPVDNKALLMLIDGDVFGLYASSHNWVMQRKKISCVCRFDRGRFDVTVEANKTGTSSRPTKNKYKEQ